MSEPGEHEGQPKKPETMSRREVLKKSLAGAAAIIGGVELGKATHNQGLNPLDRDSSENRQESEKAPRELEVYLGTVTLKKSAIHNDGYEYPLYVREEPKMQTANEAEKKVKLSDLKEISGVNIENMDEVTLLNPKIGKGDDAGGIGLEADQKWIEVLVKVNDKWGRDDVKVMYINFGGETAPNIQKNPSEGLKKLTVTGNEAFLSDDPNQTPIETNKVIQSDHNAQQ